MIDQLATAFDFQQKVVGLHQERHEILASNIANADTPHYKARDIDFASELKKALEGDRGPPTEGLSLVRTSVRHIEGQAEPLTPALDERLLYRIPAQPSLDGNTVEMEQERTQFLDNALRYRIGLTMVNKRIQGLKEAMQPE
jgi:flagellar basal-body rod protein FlgB